MSHLSIHLPPALMNCARDAKGLLVRIDKISEFTAVARDGANQELLCLVQRSLNIFSAFW